MMMMMTTAVYTALIVYNFHFMTNFRNSGNFFWLGGGLWRRVKRLFPVTTLSIKRRCEKFRDVYILIQFLPSRFDRRNIWRIQIMKLNGKH